MRNICCISAYYVDRNQEASGKVYQPPVQSDPSHAGTLRLATLASSLEHPLEDLLSLALSSRSAWPLSHAAAAGETKSHMYLPPAAVLWLLQIIQGKLNVEDQEKGNWRIH